MIEKLSALDRHYSNGGLPGVCRAVFGHFTPTYPFLRAKLRYYRQQFDAAPTVHPFAIYTVDPGVIERHVPYSVFHKFPNAGRVRAGEWDRDTQPLGSYRKYALLRRYLNGDVDGAALTDDLLRDHGYTEFEARMYTEYGYARYLEELVDSMTADGVWVDPPAVAESPIERYDYVAVDVGRDGELLFDGHGWHRLAIAHACGVEIVPIRVNAIHEEWYGSHGSPAAHPALTLLTRVPIPWRDLYALETCSTKRPAAMLEGQTRMAPSADRR